METEEIVFNGRKITLYNIGAPMSHKDWHEAEENDLVYVRYCHHGPDYWDAEVLFCKKEDKELVDEWVKSQWW